MPTFTLYSNFTYKNPHEQWHCAVDCLMNTKHVVMHTKVLMVKAELKISTFLAIETVVFPYKLTKH